MSVTLFIINKIRGVSNSSRSACLQISIIMFLTFLKQYDNLTLYIATYLCQTMSPKYRYKFRCFCNALFSCSRLILLIQTNVLKLYREILTECLATSALCSPSNEECHLVLRPDKRFSCLRRIRRQRNQLYPFSQILEACFDVWQHSASTRVNALHKRKFHLYTHMHQEGRQQEWPSNNGGRKGREGGGG